MAHDQYTQPDRPVQAHLSELSMIFDNLDDGPLLEHIRDRRFRGRHGHNPQTMWRAYIASFILNLPHTNALIRRLEDERDLRYLCGFGDQLPHRCTFNRFIRTLSERPDLVEACLASITNRLKTHLPDLGDQVAVDSTTVRSHCSPNRALVSDPEASWTAKNSPRGKDGEKEWHIGYKVHMVADVNHSLPITMIVTTAKRGDSPLLPQVVEKAESLYSWFRPSAVVADRGYDSHNNHHYLNDKGILPIIHIKRNGNHPLYKGIYTKKGVPTCLGQVPMDYIRSDPDKGHLYRCRGEGCHLKDTVRGGLHHCDTEVWEDPSKDIRLFGVIRRNSRTWKTLYAKRQAIERVFKGMKQSRRLEAHCVRGLRQVSLHAMMSTLSYQVTSLVRILSGEADRKNRMVRQVA